ncbi:PREDICTED: uncharacterized protein LOC109125906 [Camelina sativa]|uniref:Uncharacterized protein LOC109125906 n=1 Tax=Camelina sativa TaxID=90675 RepID=A0ABM1QBV3_CAMSA|nr:PREDICTED: uncharacterized protein LOC109125906 [Camelina sativa]
MNLHDAFLYGDLEEEVYMTILSSFWASGPNKTYGDYSLFYLEQGVMWLYVLIYVDDLLIGGNNSGAIYWFKEYLSECIKMKDFGHLKYLLGIEVAHSSQVSWPFDTPKEQNHMLQIDADGPYADPGQYHRLVKRLIYLTAALRVIRYPKGCPGQGLWLSANRDQTLSAYCNSDYQSVLLHGDLCQREKFMRGFYDFFVEFVPFLEEIFACGWGSKAKNVTFLDVCGVNLSVLLSLWESLGHVRGGGKRRL